MSENTKVVLKYKGEEDKTYDITNPEDLAAFKRTAEKGRWYEKNEEDINKKLKKMEELEGKAKIADNWESYLASVKSGQIPVEDLYSKFDEMGIKLTAQDKKDLADDFDDDGRYSSLQKKIDTLEAKIQDNVNSQTANQIERTFKTLAKKYDGTDGLPKFDPEEVAAYVKKKDMYMSDIEETYENAYYMMNRDEILKAERNRSDDEKKRLERKREGLAEEAPNKVGKYTFKEPLDTSKSWNKLAQEVIEDMAKQGQSVFVDEQT